MPKADDAETADPSASARHELLRQLGKEARLRKGSLTIEAIASVVIAQQLARCADALERISFAAGSL